MKKVLISALVGAVGIALFASTANTTPVPDDRPLTFSFTPQPRQRLVHMDLSGWTVVRMKNGRLRTSSAMILGHGGIIDAGTRDATPAEAREWAKYFS